MSRFNCPLGINGSWATTFDGSPAVKVMTKRGDGSIAVTPYSGCTLWRFTPFSYPTLQSFREAVKLKQQTPQTMIVYGRLRPDLDRSAAHRRWWAKHDDRANTLYADDTAIVFGDFDKIKIPSELVGYDKWREAAQWVIANRVPPVLRTAQWLVIPSSSTGSSPVLTSFRAAVRLSRRVPLAALKEWAKGAKAAGFDIDPCVYQTAQPIYCARPVFVNMTDPLVAPEPFIIDGAETIDINLGEYAAAAEAYDRNLARTLQSVGGDWRGKLAVTANGIEGVHTPLKRACRVAVKAGVGLADWIAGATAALHEATSSMEAWEAVDRLSPYTETELARMHRDFSKYEQSSRAELSALRHKLGLEG